MSTSSLQTANPKYKQRTSSYANISYSPSGSLPTFSIVKSSHLKTGSSSSKSSSSKSKTTSTSSSSPSEKKSTLLSRSSSSEKESILIKDKSSQNLDINDLNTNVEDFTLFNHEYLDKYSDDEIKNAILRLDKDNYYSDGPSEELTDLTDMDRENLAEALILQIKYVEEQREEGNILYIPKVVKPASPKLSTGSPKSVSPKLSAAKSPVKVAKSPSPRSSTGFSTGITGMETLFRSPSESRVSPSSGKKSSTSSGKKSPTSSGSLNPIFSPKKSLSSTEGEVHVVPQHEVIHVSPTEEITITKVSSARSSPPKSKVPSPPKSKVPSPKPSPKEVTKKVTPKPKPVIKSKVKVSPKPSPKPSPPKEKTSSPSPKKSASPIPSPKKSASPKLSPPKETSRKHKPKPKPVITPQKKVISKKTIEKIHKEKEEEEATTPNRKISVTSKPKIVVSPVKPKPKPNIVSKSKEAEETTEEEKKKSSPIIIRSALKKQGSESRMKGKGIVISSKVEKKSAPKSNSEKSPKVSSLQKKTSPVKIVISPKKKPISPSKRQPKVVHQTEEEEDKEHVVAVLRDIARIYNHIAEKGGLSKGERGATLGRARAFTHAADVFKDEDLPYEYGHLREAGIGDHTAYEILEIHTTGTSKRFEELSQEYGEEVFPQTEEGAERMAVIDLFDSIKYIGKAKAAKLYDAGYRTIDDVQEDKENLLTHAQKMYVLYYDDLKSKIPRREMDEWVKLFTEVFGCKEDIEKPKKKQFRWKVCGSYRRGEVLSSDIDLIVMNISTEKLGKMLEEYTEDHIMRGKHKYSAIIRLGESMSARQIDITTFDEDQWYYALLHATGSAAFTKLMQLRAHDQGYKILNTYGLFTDKGEMITVNSEEEIFEALDVPYIEPAARHETISHLGHESELKVHQKKTGKKIKEEISESECEEDDVVSLQKQKKSKKIIIIKKK